MLGDYSRMDDIMIAVPNLSPEYEYALFDTSGNEIEGATYRRQTLEDCIYTDEEPAGYRMTWQPTDPGEIWSFQACLLFPYVGAREPKGATEFSSIYVLYGSLQGKRVFRILDATNIPGRRRIVHPRSN